MIPKVIYYIWFGGKPLNKEQIKCINSWKRFFPDYEIKEINESNFDVNQCKLSSIAYKEKWYQYVSDYVRLKILYDNGGIYFDTDVEVISSFDDILNKGSFFGFSSGVDGRYYVATGLGIGCEKDNDLIKMLIDQYEMWDENSFLDEKGFHKVPPCPTFNLPIFEGFGVKMNNEYQVIKGIHFYPNDYFEGFDLVTRLPKVTTNTCAIHHYTGYANDKIDNWYMCYHAKLNAKHKRQLQYSEVRMRMILFHPIKYLRYHIKHK